MGFGGDFWILDLYFLDNPFISDYFIIIFENDWKRINDKILVGII